MSTILLFDIDGTLVDTGGAGRRAMEAAFSLATDLPGRMRFSFGGMTDRAIVRKALETAGAPADDSNIERVIERYLERLRAEVESATYYRVLPGVRALLAELGQKSDVAIGLGTGNVRIGAEIKLAHGALDSSFEFGGFGCDSEDRATLLDVGARRGAEKLGLGRAECRVVVIGDTLRDVEAALKIGAECVAVATGSVPLETLAASGATAVFSQLGEPGVADALLASVS